MYKFNFSLQVDLIVFIANNYFYINIMGCFSETDNKHRQRPIANNINTITSNKFPLGEYFYITHKELESIKGNVVGGKQNVEISLSLREFNINIYDISKYSISVSISSINDNTIFNNLGLTQIAVSDRNNTNPTFNTTFLVDYCFEKHQYLKFDILYNNQQISQTQTTIGKVFGSRNHSTEFIIEDSNKQYYLIASIHAIQEDVKNSLVSFNIIAGNSNLNTNNIFVVISNYMTNTNTWQPVYKSKETQIRDGILNISTSNIYINDICQGDYNKNILIEFIDSKSGGIIRKGETSLNKAGENQIIDSNGTWTYNMGFNIHVNRKFINYIEQGLQISALIGIDYTESNGEPSKPESLHYILGQEPNQYEQAIRSCGSVIAYYDYDQKFPVIGFGGILPNTSMANHSFNVNFNADPNVDGVEGVINSYKNSINYVQLSYPTYFAPLIRNMVNYVESAVQNNTGESIYYVMLILTDGCIHDFDATRDIIYEAARLPISIIIVGVGNSMSEFRKMEILDGDKEPLKNSKGAVVERDIVQFVIYNNFKGDLNKLAEQVLYEVPSQVEQYYKKYNFKGNK